MSKTGDQLRASLAATADPVGFPAMTDSYLEQMEAHLDEGGTLSHANAVDLFKNVLRLRAALKEGLEYFEEREDITHQGCANEEMMLAHETRNALGRGYDARTFTPTRPPLRSKP